MNADSLFDWLCFYDCPLFALVKELDLLAAGCPDEVDTSYRQ
jgi:hypothetical protein